MAAITLFAVISIIRQEEIVCRESYLGNTTDVRFGGCFPCLKAIGMKMTDNSSNFEAHKMRSSVFAPSIRVGLLYVPITRVL